MTTRMPFVHILPLPLEELRICALVLLDGKTPVTLSPEFLAPGNSDDLGFCRIESLL